MFFNSETFEKVELEQIEMMAMRLYGLIHARYILTTRGMAQMVPLYTLSCYNNNNNLHDYQFITLFYSFFLVYIDRMKNIMTLYSVCVLEFSVKVSACFLSACQTGRYNSQ